MITKEDKVMWLKDKIQLLKTTLMLLNRDQEKLNMNAFNHIHPMANVNELYGYEIELLESTLQDVEDRV